MAFLSLALSLMACSRVLAFPISFVSSPSSNKINSRRSCISPVISKLLVLHISVIWCHRLMEAFSHLGGGSTRSGFICSLSSTAEAATATSSPPPLTASMYGGEHYFAALPNLHHHQGEAGSSQRQYERSDALGDVDAMKAKIISHPQYSTLLAAYMDCQKVGAPPEVVARLSAVSQEFEARQRAAGSSRRDAPCDPELDQFMEAYCNMLANYKKELTRPIQEAMDFLRRAESQLNTLSNGSARIFSSDEKCKGVGSSEEDEEGSGGEAEHSEIDPRSEDRELKHHLLKKYSGYLSSLRQELSKKKKKGKLPKEARQKLFNWWELHYKWPYPSEAEKVALAESTGLDQKQINNWFINQRKRHWKPSEDVQFVMMDGYHPQNASALYMEGQFMGDDTYRLGP